MKTILLIICMSIVCFGQIGTTSNKVKLADSIGNYVGTTIIDGKKAIDIKIRDTIRIRDSAKVYAKITDSIRAYAKITDSIRGYMKITDSIKAWVKIPDSIKAYAKITDTVRVRGIIDTVIHIKDTIKTRSIDTSKVSIDLVYLKDTAVTIFGQCVDPPATKSVDTTVDIWPLKSVYVFPTAQAAVVCSSSSRFDSLGAIGVDSISMDYLDNTYAMKMLTMPVRGTRPCTSSVSDIFRINHCHARHTGSSYRAVGNIYIRKLGALTPVYAIIPAGFTHPRSAKYTVPLGKTFYITSLSLSVGGTSVNAGQSATIILRATYDRERNLALTPGLFFLPHYEVDVVNQAFKYNFEIPLNFPAGTDLKLSCQAVASNSVIDCFIMGSLR